MKKIDRLEVKYHDRLVGSLSLTPDDRLCVFEYAPAWLVDGYAVRCRLIIEEVKDGCGSLARFAIKG